MTDEKILITGPGRAGTTFLVRLFTRLGYDTGFIPYEEPYDIKVRAGCEWRVNLPADKPENARRVLKEAPQILKSPEWALMLKWLLTYNTINIKHIFLPLRDFEDAARSRLNAKIDWLVEPGTYDDRFQQQTLINAATFGRAIEACMLFNIPITIPLFPLFVEDIDYCYRKVSECWDNVDREKFEREYKILQEEGQLHMKGVVA
jgi:hypothetical protein